MRRVLCPLKGELMYDPSRSILYICMRRALSLYKGDLPCVILKSACMHILLLGHVRNFLSV